MLKNNNKNYPIKIAMGRKLNLVLVLVSIKIFVIFLIEKHCHILNNLLHHQKKAMVV